MTVENYVTSVDIGGSGEKASVGGIWSGRAFGPANNGAIETVLRELVMTEDFWPGTLGCMWFHAVVQTVTAGNRRLRTYANETLTYDSGNVRAIGGGCLIVDLTNHRLSDTVLSVVTRAVGSSQTPYLAASLVDVTVDFTKPITIKITGQGETNGDLRYHHGTSRYEPPPTNVG